MTESQTVEFIPLKGFDDYEILSVHPFTIRRKDNHHEMSERIHNGYIDIKLNGKRYLKHRLIGLQFIPNDDPEHKTQLDHISHDKTDNHLNNLRWVSNSVNQINKSSNRSIEYEFIDDLPEDVIMIDYYETKNGRREFEENRYYYYFNEETNEDVIYSKITDNLYRIMHLNQNRAGNHFVNARDINNKNVALYINRFKFQRNLID